MTIEKQTKFDRIELNGDGTMSVRLLKRVVDTDTGEDIINPEYHRTVVPADVPAAEQMAYVNTHLGTSGWPAVPDEVIAKMQAHRELDKTPNGKLAELVTAASGTLLDDQTKIAANYAGLGREYDALRVQYDRALGVLEQKTAKLSAVEQELEQVRSEAERLTQERDAAKTEATAEAVKAASALRELGEVRNERKPS